MSIEEAMNNMRKSMNTIECLLAGRTESPEVKEVNISIHSSRQRVLEHPTPTTYVWHMERHVDERRYKKLSLKELELAYARR